jgi:hypothetical protein
MGRPTNVTMNYSTLPLREIFALEEARARSEEVVSRLGPSDFNMPWMNARCDLLAAELLGGNLAQVEAGWSALWDEARASRAWVRWHISGRSAEIRAEYEIERGRYGDALEWGRRALELAQASSRIKYEVLARITVAKALIAQGIGDEAASELRTAVAAADRLGSPLLRWQARATLADVGAKVKDGIDVDAIRSEAVAIVREIVAGLSNEHAKGYLAAPAVATLLEGA